MNPGARRGFAAEGSLRLTRVGFHRDCRALLEGDGILAECLRNLLAALGTLSDEEIEAMATLLPAEDTTFFRMAARAVRQSKSEVTFALLHPALDQWWDSSLRVRLSKSFRRMSVAQ